MKNVLVLLVLSMFLTSVPTACSAQKDGQKVEKRKKKRRKKVRLPKIDLTNWKVTLPIGDPLEYAYPAILDYAKNDTLNKFMYADSSQGALVFYTYPSQTTKNTKYSRTELREQMVPGKNNVNWTFEQGGKMKATMAMESITKDDEGKYHKTIILQIHGRLTNEQRDRLGKDDNDAPPMLKIYWKDGKIRVKTKVLKDPNADELEILRKDAWTDDEGHTFKEKVDFNRFTIEVQASKGKLLVILNNNEFKSYEGPDMDKWGVFENYFKAGNYLSTTDPDASAKVKFYRLEVSH